MKRVFIILFFIIMFCPFTVDRSGQRAYAEEEEPDINETVNTVVNELDTSSYDEFIDYLKGKEGSIFNETIKTLIQEVLSGNVRYDFSYFKDYCIKLLLGELGDVLPELILMIIIAFFTGILENVSSGFAKKDVRKIVYLACYALVITIIGFMVSKSIVRSVETFEILEKFADGCMPVLLTVLSSIGGSASAGIYQPFVLIFGSVLIKMIKVVIMPLFYTTFVFGIVGNLSDDLHLEKITKGVKSVAQWILGIAFGLFMTLLTAQGITGASFDGLASRGAKFALSGYVPIVGNYLKEGFDIVVASCIVVKNSLGLCSVIILLFAILAPIIRVVVMILGFKITSGIMEPIADRKFAAAVNSSAESMKILIVALLCASFALLIVIMMIIFSCNFGSV